MIVWAAFGFGMTGCSSCDAHSLYGSIIKPQAKLSLLPAGQPMIGHLLIIDQTNPANSLFSSTPLSFIHNRLPAPTCTASLLPHLQLLWSADSLFLHDASQPSWWSRLKPHQHLCTLCLPHFPSVLLSLCPHPSSSFSLLGNLASNSGRHCKGWQMTVCGLLIAFCCLCQSFLGQWAVKFRSAPWVTPTYDAYISIPLLSTHTLCTTSSSTRFPSLWCVAQLS